VKNLVVQKIEEFERLTGNKVVYVSYTGSKLYGTDSPTSDSDFKGVFIPSKRSLLLADSVDHYSSNSNNTTDKNGEDDIDFSLMSIHRFFSQLSKSETGAIDLLFSMWRPDTIMYEDIVFTASIRRNYKDFLNSSMKSFIGYALGQTKKFGIKGARYKELDTLINNFRVNYGTDHKDKLETRYDDLKQLIKDNDFKYIKFVMAKANRDTYEGNREYISVLGKLFLGTVTLEYFSDKCLYQYRQFGNRTKTIANTPSKTDFKALSHSYRIASEALELLTNEFIVFPLAEASYIKEIKEGKHDLSSVVDKVESVLDAIDIELSRSKLPSEPDKKTLDTLLIEMVEYKW